MCYYSGSGYVSSGGFQDSPGQYFKIYNLNVKFDNKLKSFLTLGIEATKKLKKHRFAFFKIELRLYLFKYL